MSDPSRTSQQHKKLLAQESRISVLKEMLAYYKEITETVREPFIILDKELRVITANISFYRMFKVRKKETVGRRIYELGNNQWEAPELRELLEHILPKHRVLNDYEVVHDFPDLGHKTMLLNARQVDSKQLILLAIEDITTQRQLKLDADEMTANLVKQRDQLQRLNVAKDEFVSMASHQLRTPATEVKQYVGMLSQGYAGKLSKDQMAMLNVAYESNQRQLEIIEDLLRVARVDDGKVYLEKSSCDIIKQMEAVIQGQRVLFRHRGQTISLNKPHKRVIAIIDQKLMRMVFDNLLDNAGKYSSAGGHVTVDIEQKNGFTTISIQDSGVGIRKQDQRKLFKKFSRIDNSFSTSVSGTGLGLYWVKKILDLHNGSIDVLSNQHKGSTFTVRMPIDPQPA